MKSLNRLSGQFFPTYQDEPEKVTKSMNRMSISKEKLILSKKRKSPNSIEREDDLDLEQIPCDMDVLRSLQKSIILKN